MGFFDSIFGRRKASPVQIQLRAPSDSDGFCLMLANVLFRIDGTVSPEEQEHLDRLTEEVPQRVRERIEKILESPDVFVQIRNWYNALGEAEKSLAKEEVKKLVQIDKERTEEEEAFLIQFAQITEGHDRLPLYVSTELDKANGKLPNHNFFRYVSARQFPETFPNAETVFRSGNVYVDHPYINDSLIPFTAHDFEQAQDQLFGGVIELLKELGAKSVHISESMEEVEGDRQQGKVSVDAKSVTTGSAQLAGGADFSLERILRTKDTVNVRFDGSKPPLLRRLFPQRWHQQLLRRYRNNPQCLTIIKNRFGHNKASYFKHQVKSMEARSVAKGINAAAKLDYKLVKAGANVDYQSKGTVTRTIEKTLTVHFH